MKGAKRHAWVIVCSFTGALALGQPALILKDVQPGPSGSSPRTRGPDEIAPFAISALGKLFTVRDDGTNGRQVWVSDGSFAGTKRVSDVDGACFGVEFRQSLCFPRELTASGAIVYFISRGETDAGGSLWRTDGTTIDRTRRIKSNLWTGIVTESFRGWLTDVDGTLFFAAPPPGVSGEEANELWKSDATSAGTTLVKDIVPGAPGSTPRQLTSAGGRLYFLADDGTHGFELWISDGTGTGTRLVKDIRPGLAGQLLVGGAALGKLLIFAANDGVHGQEAWRSDGTAGGTSMLADINSSGDSLPELFTAVGGAVYFVASDALNVARLWRTDGTSTGTRPLIGPDYGIPSNLTAVGNELFFMGKGLWRTSGTEAGTILVHDLSPLVSAIPFQLTAVEDQLFFAVSFTAPDGSNGYALWASDGTHAGTGFVQDWVHNTTSSMPEDLVGAGSQLFFNVRDDVHGDEPWVLPTATPCGSDVIVDNGTATTSSTGSWRDSGAFLSYGGSSLWAKATSTVVPTYTFDRGAASATPVTYEIFEWHSVFSTRTRLAPHRIVHDGGTTEVPVDQSVAGGQWNSLGLFTFTGKVPRVRILAVDRERSTNADAMLFRQIVPCPIAVIESITPSPTTAGVDEVCFRGSGASSGNLEWTSSLQPGVLLGTASAFCAADLIPGTHTIALRVRDTVGRLSLPEFATLEVRENPAGCNLEVIVDNGAKGTSSMGSWSPSGAPGFFGTGSVYTRRSSGSTSEVFYAFSADLPPGTYEVFEWHTVWPTRTGSAAHQILVNGALADARYVDQSVGGGKWSSLGLHVLPSGGTCTVRIIAADTERSTNADAIRFVCRSAAH